jgi:hypothetical protein
MKIKINYEEINNITGAGITRPAALLHYVRGLIDYLYTHNKNYNKTQYYKIEELKTIIENITEV